MSQINSMTTAMMVALGENGIKSLDDFADCATDDLCGWVERSKERGVEPTRHKGFLDGFEVSRQEAEEMILAARILLGWIKPEDLNTPQEDGDDVADDEGEAMEADGDAAAITPLPEPGTGA